MGDVLTIRADAGEQANIDPIVAAHETLPEQKTKRKIDIDVRTKSLIADGFTYDSKGFSLSIEAQANWLGIKSLESLLTFPMEITADNDAAYSLTSVNVDAFVSAAVAAKQGHLDSGRTLKVSIDAAADQTALDAIVDSR